jgi:hypothetical protein
MSRNLTDLEAAEAAYLIAAIAASNARPSADFNLFEHTPVAIEALRAVNPAKAADLERHFVVFLAAQRAKGAAYAALSAATTAAAAADAAYTAGSAADDLASQRAFQETHAAVDAAEAAYLAAEAEARRTFNLLVDAFTLDAPAGARP